MKIVIAPDSFKESMDSLTASAAIKEGITEIVNDIDLEIFPMADGGEGTLQVIKYYNQNCSYIKARVNNPLGKLIDAHFLYIPEEREVIIEMAEAAGINRVDENERNPLLTSTYGVGELVTKAMEFAPKKMIITLGGSVTNDGGIGFLSALGMRFLDENNYEVSNNGLGLDKVKYIKNHSVLEKFKDVEIIVLSDVMNPLLGDYGATRTFSRQKGATQEVENILENAMNHYANVIEDTFGVSKRLAYGSGAAGGLGFALHFFPNIKVVSGSDFVISLSKIENAIRQADMIIIGEGSLDEQSAYGKITLKLSNLAKKYEKKVIAFVGVHNDNDTIRRKNYIDHIYNINDFSEKHSDILKIAKVNIKNTAIRFAKTLKDNQ